MTDPTTLAARLRTEAEAHGKFHPSDKHHLAMLTEAADLIEQQQAIIDRLPKTADGVPVVPGQRYWTIYPNNIEPVEEFLVTSVCNFVVCGAEDGEQSAKCPMDDCHEGCDPGTPTCELFSTKEAAEAARVGKEK